LLAAAGLGRQGGRRLWRDLIGGRPVTDPRRIPLAHDYVQSAERLIPWLWVYGGIGVAIAVSYAVDAVIRSERGGFPWIDVVVALGWFVIAIGTPMRIRQVRARHARAERTLAYSEDRLGMHPREL
jgi:hypothetical protein